MSRADDLGITSLLEHLTSMTGRDTFLWYTPGGRSDYRWRVWDGAPNGSSGAEWGHGETPIAALHEAFRRLVDAIFEGRLQSPASGSSDDTGEGNR